MSMSRIGFACALAAVGASFSGTAANMRELAFQVAIPAKVSPVMDGALDDACWKETPVHGDYYEYLKPNPRRVTNVKTECRLVYDQKGVYVGIRNWDNNISKLKQNCRKNDMNDMWYDDSGEIYFDPDAMGVGYYRFVVNSLGKYDCSWRMDGANMHYDWTCGGIVCAGKVFDDRWEVELFVPWSGFHGRTCPKPGTIWTFNHSRFCWSQGWGPGFSTTAPGGAGCTPQKFGYLYFSDGSRPDARAVLDILEARLKEDWGIAIDGKVYVHDATGTRVTDLVAAKKQHEQDFRTLEAALEPRLAAEKNSGFDQTFAKTRVSFTNELAKFDGSFAAVKIFGELVDTLKDLECKLAMGDLTSTNAAVIARAKKLELPLAGKYDLNPPKTYRGHNGWFRHNFIKDAYKTPHLGWTAKDGEESEDKAKILFLPSFGSTVRDCVEYVQRFGGDATFFPGNFGVTGTYEDPISLGTFNDKHTQFETLLAKNPELIVQWGFKDQTWPAKYRHEVLRRVRDEGLGLVILGRSGGFADVLRKLKSDDDSRRAIVAATPLNEFIGNPNRRTPPHGMAPSERNLSCYRFGKGRVAVVNDFAPGGWSLKWKAEYESRHAFMRNVFNWALGRERGADIVFETNSERDEFAASSNFIAFDVRVKDAALARKVRYRLRTAYNEVVTDKTGKLSKGSNVIAVPTDTIAGGDYYLDVIALNDAGVATATAVRPFTKAAALGKLTIGGTNMIVVAENTVGVFNLRWDRSVPAGSTLRFDLCDRPYDQLRFFREYKLKKDAVQFQVKLDSPTFPALAARAKATIYSKDGKELASCVKMAYFPNHRFEDYTLISWDSVNTGNLPEFFAPKLIGELGYRNHLGATEEKSANFDCRAVPYIARVNLGGGKDGTSWGTIWTVLGWGGKGSKEGEERAKLGNDWNIHRPEVQAHIEKYFTPKVQKTAPFGVSVWSLGDECGFSNDIGFGTNAAPYFAAFLKEDYGTIEKLNAAHGTSYKDFAEVPHKKCDQAVKDKDWPSWIDQVRYAERLYSDTYQFLSKVIKKYDPKGRVGAEGSAAGDLEQTVEKLEFWGPYRSLVSDELLKSIAPDRVRGTWWGGYMGDPRNGFPVGQWTYVLTGTVNADEWFQFDPGTTHAAHAGDFSTAPYVAKMLPHLQKLRRGQAQLLLRTPWRKDGVALYFSHVSNRASTLDDRLLPGNDSLGELIRFCYRKGYAVEMITRKTIKKLEGQKVLFLAGATALADDEIAALKDFVRKGGVLISDQPPALLTEHCQIRKEAPLKELFGDWTLANLKEPETAKREMKGTVKFNGKTVDFTVKGDNLRTYPNVAGFTWKSYGKGGALLLNTTVSSIAVNEGLEATDQLVQSALDLAGVKIPESCTGMSLASEVFRVRQLSLGKNGKMTLAGFKTDVQQLGKDITLDFGKEGYIYEVDTGFVGKQQKVELKNLAIPFKLYTQFAEEQKIPVFALVGGDLRAPRAGQLSVAPGTWLTYATKDLRQGSVYRLEVFKPVDAESFPRQDKDVILSIGRGKDSASTAIVCREEVFCADAKKEPKRRFQFPYSDKPGRYTVKLTDIATGLVAEQAVTVAK